MAPTTATSICPFSRRRERDLLELQLRSQGARLQMLEEAVAEGSARAATTWGELQAQQLAAAEREAEMQQLQVRSLGEVGKEESGGQRWACRH